MWHTCKAKRANFTRELLRQIFSPPEGVSAFDTAPDGRILAAVPGGADSGSSGERGAELGFGIEEINLVLEGQDRELCSAVSRAALPTCTFYISLRPSIAFSIVISSVYSMSLPTGIPIAMRVTFTPTRLSCCER